jgi:hypothetical protein
MVICNAYKECKDPIGCHCKPHEPEGYFCEKDIPKMWCHTVKKYVKCIEVEDAKQ